MRKTNVAFNGGLFTHKDLTGQAATISGEYRLDGTADTWTSIATAFVEDKPGKYVAPITIATPGIYEFSFASTNNDIGTHEGKIEISNNNLDDIRNAVDAAQLDITGIKAVTDLLNTTELENLAEQITQLSSDVQAVNVLIGSTDANDGITSITELLNTIQTGGINVDNLLNGQTDIREMVLGSAFLQDGTTVNPVAGKGLTQIFDKVDTMLVDVQTSIAAAQTSIESNITLFKTSVEAKVQAVQVVVDSNAAILGDVTFGNAALRTAIDTLSTKTTTDTNALTAILNDATNGLAAVKTTIMDKLAIMDGKLDTGLSKMDQIIAAQTAKTSVEVYL